MAAVITGAVFVLLPFRTAEAANPSTINFQGKVVNNTTGNVGINVADGTYSFVFRIYNTASPTTATACGSDSTCLFEETQGSVTVTSGVFQVELGSTCSGGLTASNTCTKSVAGGINFNTNSALYLTMKFNGDAAGFMSPTIHLTTVPYAYNADNLGGISSSGFIQNTTTPQSANIAIQSSSSTNIGEVIKGAASQSADFFQVQDSSGNILDRLDAGGNFDSSGYLTNPSGGLGAYGNALNWGEGFDNIFAWLRTNVTAPTADTIVDPTGATTAEALADSASGGKAYQTTAIVPSNTSYTFSVWLKAPSGTQNVDLRIDGSTTGTGTVKTVTATTTWQRFFVTQNVNGFTGFVQPTIFPGGTGGSATIHAWGAQLVQGTSMGVYTRTGNSLIQSVGRGLVVNGNVLVDPQSSTTAFMVQSGDQSPIFVVDTQNQLIALGQKGQYNGRIDFTNSAGNNTVTLLAQGVNPTSSLSIFLPTAGGSGVQCLQSTSGSTTTSTVLQFGSCSGGGSTLASSYNSAGTSGNTITYTTAGAGIVIQDASTPLTGNLLTIQNNSATFNYLSLNLASGIPHLKVFGASSSNYADIYYDAGTSSAVFAASSGTTVVGSGTGDITISAGTGSAVNITANAASTWKTTAGNLTVDSGGGTVVLGSSTTTLQKVASSLTWDVSNGASNSTLTVSNSGGAGNITLALDSGGTYAVGASNGSTISACSSTQFVSSQAVTGGIVTGGSCTNAVTSLASAYNSSGTAGNTITLSSAGGGVFIQDAATPIAANLFTVQANGTNATPFLNITASNLAVNVNTDNTGYMNTPFGGFGQYSNLLKQSEAFDQVGGTPWTMTSITNPTLNTVVSPDGNTTAESLADSGSGGKATQAFTTSTVGNYTFSVWLKAAANQNVDLRIDSTGTNAQTGTVKTVVATTAWQRFFVTQNITGPTISTIVVNIFPGQTGGSGTVSAWGAQLVTGTSPQVYIRTTVAAVTTATTGLNVSGNSVFNPVTNSTTAFQVQNAGGTTVLGIDTTNFNVFLGNTSNTNTIKLASGVTSSSYTIILPTAGASAANYCLVMSNTGTGATSWSACGAGSTASLSLTPEFPGAVLTPDGANNTGTMTSDFCGNDGAGSFADLNTGVCNTSGDFHNYYNWTSNGANDYDVFVRWRVPSDFSSFSSVQFNSKKSATGDDVKLTIYTNSGAACGTGTSMTNTASAWQTTTYTISGCAPAAGDTLILDIHMAVAANGNTVQMGEIPISYNRN